MRPRRGYDRPPEEPRTRINEAIRAGTLYNRGGQKLSAPIEGALLRSDGAVAYPIIDSIYVLLADEGIAVDTI